MIPNINKRTLAIGVIGIHLVLVLAGFYTPSSIVGNEEDLYFPGLNNTYPYFGTLKEEIRVPSQSLPISTNLNDITAEAFYSLSDINVGSPAPFGTFMFRQYVTYRWFYLDGSGEKTYDTGFMDAPPNHNNYDNRAQVWEIINVYSTAYNAKKNLITPSLQFYPDDGGKLYIESDNILQFYGSQYDQNPVDTQYFSSNTVITFYDGTSPSPNSPPTADFYIKGGTTTDPLPLAGIQAVSQSTDSDGAILKYEWDAGDGYTKTEIVNPNETPYGLVHFYTAVGTYTVSLTVTDDDGATGSFSVDVTVPSPANNPPIAKFTSEDQSVGTSYAVVLRDISTDSDGRIAARQWFIDDVEYWSTNGAITYRPGAPGTYKITLKVTDDDGATDSLSITVTFKSDTSTPPPETYSPISGTVTDADNGMPVVNALITINGADVELTASDGTFQTDDYLDGDYQVTISQKDYETSTFTLPTDFANEIRLTPKTNNSIADLDGDGIPDHRDSDIDGDGVPNDRDADPYDPDVGAFPEFSPAMIIIPLIGGILILAGLLLKSLDPAYRLILALPGVATLIYWLFQQGLI